MRALPIGFVIAALVGFVAGFAWAGIYAAVPAGQGPGVWRTNKLTGTTTYCTIQRDPPEEPFGRRFVECLDD